MGERREAYLIKALCDTSVLVPPGIRKKLVIEDDKNIKGAMKIAREEINNLLKNQKRPF